MEDVYTGIRIVNALLASVVFFMLVYRGRLAFDMYSKQQKLLHASFTLYALGVAYGSVEAYTQHIPSGPRVFILLAANLLAIVAFIRYRRSAFTGQDVSLIGSDEPDRR